jgi:hypothetical protein
LQGYIEAVTPKKLNHVKDVLPGSGAAIQSGTKQAAVYRDEDGKAHVFTGEKLFLFWVVFVRRLVPGKK